MKQSALPWILLFCASFVILLVVNNAKHGYTLEDIRSVMPETEKREEKSPEPTDPLLFLKYPGHDCLDALVWSKSSIEPQNVFTKEYLADFQDLEDEVLRRGKTKNGHIGQGIIGQNIFWKVANQSFINTICETGFNLGHSTLLWMHANPRAHVYSFDIGGTIRTEYADYISKKFPGRFNITWGDSTKSIPMFVKNHTNVVCDMVVVDGGHNYGVAFPDVKNFRMLANKKRNILVADNTEMHGVKKTWSQALQSKWIRQDMNCMYNYTKKYSVGIGHYV